MDKTPTTLLEAVTYFSDPDRAFAYAVKLRWPNGVACPRMGCGSAAVIFIKTRKLTPETSKRASKSQARRRRP